MKHNIPLGTGVSFEGQPYVYRVADYQTLLGPCPPDCKEDHDCYTEPYVKVHEITGTAFPLSKLELIFDQPAYGIPNTRGRKPIARDLGGV